MSSFLKNTLNPKTGKYEAAAWIDDFYGPHLYGVKFLDGGVYDPNKIVLKTNKDNVDVDWPNFFGGGEMKSEEEVEIKRQDEVIAINKGVPLPASKATSTTRYQFLYRMDVGDSAIFPHFDKLKDKDYIDRAQGVISYANRRKQNKVDGKRWTTRVVVENKKKVVRVWRVK